MYPFIFCQSKYLKVNYYFSNLKILLLKNFYFIMISFSQLKWLADFAAEIEKLWSFELLTLSQIVKRQYLPQCWSDKEHRCESESLYLNELSSTIPLSNTFEALTAFNLSIISLTGTKHLIIILNKNYKYWEIWLYSSKK